MAVASIVATGCGGADPGGDRPEVARPVESLGVECDSPNLDYAPVGHFVDYMTHWVELRPDGRGFNGSPIDEQTMELVTVSAAPIGDDRSPTGEFADTEFYVVSSIYDEMRAAVGDGVSFHAVVGPAPEWMDGADELLVVFAVDEAGHVGAPGYCQQIALMGPLERFAGGDAEVIELIGMPLERLEEVFAPRPPEPPPGPGEAILNPSSADPALLQSLTLTGIQVHFPADWRGPFTLCSRIAEGWNDCLPLDGRLRARSG